MKKVLEEKIGYKGDTEFYRYIVFDNKETYQALVFE